MNLQYISDNKGETTGVYIPISEWNELKKKFKGIEFNNLEIPKFQINEVRERLEIYKNNPEDFHDFEASMTEIEKEL